MEMRVDDHKFDELQTQVGFAIAHEVYTALKKAGAPDDERLEEILSEALFHIGCVIDGSLPVEGSDGPMEAVLTFRRNREDRTLLWAQGTSWIHEGAHQIAEEYFDGLRPKAARSRMPQRRAEESRLNLLDVIPTGWFGKRPKR